MSIAYLQITVGLVLAAWVPFLLLLSLNNRQPKRMILFRIIIADPVVKILSAIFLVAGAKLVWRGLAAIDFWNLPQAKIILPLLLGLSILFIAYRTYFRMGRRITYWNLFCENLIIAASFNLAAFTAYFTCLCIS